MQVGVRVENQIMWGRPHSFPNIDSKDNPQSVKYQKRSEGWFLTTIACATNRYPYNQQQSCAHIFLPRLLVSVAWFSAVLPAGSLLSIFHIVLHHGVQDWHHPPQSAIKHRSFRKTAGTLVMTGISCRGSGSTFSEPLHETSCFQGRPGELGTRCTTGTTSSAKIAKSQQRRTKQYRMKINRK